MAIMYQATDINRLPWDRDAYGRVHLKSQEHVQYLVGPPFIYSDPPYAATQLELNFHPRQSSGSFLIAREQLGETIPIF